MKRSKKVVLDADVIIHFAKGDMLSMLPTILPGFEYIVLNKVYDEVRGSLKNQLDRQIHYLKNISVVDFNPKGEELREYAMLKKNFGVGESACMAYCRFTKDIIKLIHYLCCRYFWTQLLYISQQLLKNYKH